MNGPMATRRDTRKVRQPGGEQPDLAPLLAAYRPLPGVADEMMDAQGAIRPHWRPLLQALAAMGEAQVAARFERADRYLKDSGVYYRVYDEAGGGERLWPLSHVPLVIEPGEWAALERGLIQRAALLETVLADIYGEGRLVREGALPAAVVAGSPEYLRPLVGVPPRGDAHLWLYAADIGRGPDGRFWVLSDRTQAPSGAGYVLENRLALARALPDVVRDFSVTRLAPFFDALRGALSAFNRREDTRVGLLTPGPLNETYFEHAYLARYLGFLLVEAEDLVVRGDEVFVRTVSGLKRVDVLLRRLDSDYADPLELNAASRIGVPGLVRAVRAGRVAIANALGSGVLESRAMLSFLPALARRVLGEELLLPNVATWWCGQPRERALVEERLDDMVIASAFGTPVPGLIDRSAILGRDLDAAARRRLASVLDRRGVDLVGQESAELTTTPAWINGRLEPRPFILRCFVARTADGWRVMPGAFCRVSEQADAHAVSMQHGGRSADVWVTAQAPAQPATLLPSPDQVTIRRNVGMLTSRAADNFFWLGRYLERAEATLRLVRALAGRLTEEGRRDGVVIDRLADLLRVWGAAPPPVAAVPGEAPAGPADSAIGALTSGACDSSVPAIVAQALRTASVIRDRLFPDAWRALDDLKDLMTRWAVVTNEVDAYEVATRALRILAALSGFAQENMNRLNTWRFLEIGRRLERALAICRFTRRFALDDTRADTLEALLELMDCQTTYRSRYVLGVTLAPVLDLALIDETNPRSVAFQLACIAEHLAALPGAAPGEPMDPTARIAQRLLTDLRTLDPCDFTLSQVLAIEQQLMRLSDALSRLYFTPRHMVADLGERLA